MAFPLEAPVESGVTPPVANPPGAAALTILYQDEWLVAVDKPAGMLVHAGRDPEPPDQIAMKVLRDRLTAFVYTLHRLDRPTSGVLLFALDPKTQRETQAEFLAGRARKTYLALVHGIAPESGVLDAPLQSREDEPPRECRTEFRRLAAFPPGSAATQGVPDDFACSMVEAKPVTGRLHQIRKHLHGAGHAILGDWLYGEAAVNERFAAATGIARMMLMARTLELTHPKTGAPLRVDAPPPPEFRRFQSP